jgi:hypothetical protein
MSLPCLYAFPPWILTRHQQGHLVGHILTKSSAECGLNKDAESCGLYDKGFGRRHGPTTVNLWNLICIMSRLLPAVHYMGYSVTS